VGCAFVRTCSFVPGSNRRYPGSHSTCVARDVSDEPSRWRCPPTHSRACEVEPLAEVHVPHAAAARWRWLASMRSCRALVPRSGLTAPSSFRRASCCISWSDHCSDDCFKDPLIAYYWGRATGSAAASAWFQIPDSALPAKERTATRSIIASRRLMYRCDGNHRPLPRHRAARFVTERSAAARREIAHCSRPAAERRSRWRRAA
jgi:hypothetical protein